MTKKPAKPSKTSKKGSSGGLEDEDLWGHVSAGIKPLKGHHKNRTPDVPAPPTTGEKGETTARIRKPTFLLPTGNEKKPTRLAPLPELSHASQTGLDKSTARKLKKGQQRIEGRMDLHGMTQEQAHRALNAFIDGAYHAGKRCVLVITGKGLKPDGSVGVLRAAVPRWMNQSPNRERVLAFSYATQKDGGEGALYVMLKRNK